MSGRGGRAAGASWCTKSRRPLFFRFLCTKSHAFLRSRPAPTWCTKSRRPLYLRSLYTKSRAFFRSWPGAVLVHEKPPVLVPPFPLHQVPRVFSPVAGRRLGARNSAGPCSSVSFAPSPARFFARGRAGVVPHRPLDLVSSS